MNQFSHWIVPMQFQIVCPWLTYLITIVNWLLLHLSGPPPAYMEQSTFSSISLLKKWITGWPWTYSWSWPYVLYWLNPNPDHMLIQISALDWPYKSSYDTQPCDSRQRVTLHHPMCILACDPAQWSSLGSPNSSLSLQNEKLVSPASLLQLTGEQLPCSPGHLGWTVAQPAAGAEF